MKPEEQILFLTANLGSEVLRSFSLREKAGEQEAENSLLRALAICERLNAFPLTPSARGEIALVTQELIAMKNGEIHDSRESWEKYFDPFALRITARLGK